MANNPLFPARNPISKSEIHDAIAAALLVQTDAMTQHQKRPFAAVLLGPDNKTVLLSHFSISHVEHAEACLARLAAVHYSQAYLWRCTLVSTWEPCAMCTGTIYWANIGGVVYAASEETLKVVTGVGNGENFTMAMGCREVLARGQKAVFVEGPVAEMEGMVVVESDKYWRPIRKRLERERRGEYSGPEGGIAKN
ncbi:hypothetical protein MMC26_002597 [Xylographa opegraphella]|nr:hypothetical protein [Xylographa opegraphella]